MSQAVPAVMPRTQADVPYVGLRPFERHEADRFFGRGKDAQRLSDQILSGRLTILYAQSGLGKSSLLRALAIPQLEENDARAVYFDSWAQEDPFSALREHLIEAAAGLGVADPGRGSPTLVELVRLINKAGGQSVILILDQFEEFLVHHGHEIDPLRTELAALVRSPKVDASVVLALREEFLAALEPFRQHIPNLFQGAYRLEPLSESDLRDAICRPAEACGGSCETEMAERLIQDLREKHSGSASAGPPPIELPMLQLVCQQLWRQAASGHLTRELYVRMGGAQPILDRYVRELMPEGWRKQAVTAHLLVYLAPPSGLKISYSAGDLSRMAGVKHDAITAELGRLSEARILRTRQHSAGVRYELQHDAFIQVLSSWRDHVLEREKRLHLLRWGAIGGIAGLGMYLAVYAFYVRPRDLKDLRFRAAISSSDPLVSALALAELGDSRNSEQAIADLQRVAAAPIPAAILRGANTDAPDAIASTWFVQNDVANDPVRVGTASASGIYKLWSADGNGDPQAVRSKTVSVMAVSSDQQWIAAATEKGEIEVSPAGGAVWTSITASSKRISALAVSGGKLPGSPGAGAISETVVTVHRVAAAFSDDFGVRVWDGHGNVVADLGGRTTGHTGEISAVYLDRSGNRVLTASVDGTARIWAVDKPRAPLVSLTPGRRDGHAKAVDESPVIFSAALSTDGNWVLCGLEDGRAIILDSDGKGGPVELAGHTERVTAAAFSADGQRIVTGSDDRTARVWDLRVDYVNTSGPDAPQPTFEPRLKLLGSVVLRGHAGRITSARFSQDGTKVATASTDGTTRIWRSESKEPRVLGTHNRAVEKVAFSRNGRLVASASRDGYVHIYDLEDLKGSAPAKTLRGHTDWVRGVAFSPDGKLVVTGSEDKTVRLWDLQKEEPSWTRNLGAAVLGVGFTPDGKGVVAATLGTSGASDTSDTSVLVFPVDSGTAPPLMSLDEKDWVSAASFSPDGSKIVVASSDGSARVWDISGGQSVAGKRLVSLKHGGRVFAAQFSPDGSRIVTSSDSRQARLWNLEGNNLRRFPQAGDIWQVDFSSDGQWLATASTEGAATVWDANRGLMRMSLTHGAPVRAAALRPGKPEVVTGADDGSVRLWRIGGRELLDYLKGATTACLTQLDRIQVLGEGDAKAQDRFRKCEERHQRRAATN